MVLTGRNQRPRSRRPNWIRDPAAFQGDGGVRKAFRYRKRWSRNLEAGRSFCAKK